MHEALLDHRAIDWAAVASARLAVTQSLEYRYPAPITHLRQRLMVIPPRIHGGQRLREHRLEVSTGTPARARRDRFGNRIHRIEVPSVEAAIRFEVTFTVERRAHRFPALDAGGAARFRLPTPLTAPDEALRRAARELRASGARGEELGLAIMTWVWQAITRARDVTGVRTTAAEALALGKGVCQDRAHVMLAICRLCKLPARYVSGHLLGEGHTHAWVEVLVPDPAMPGGFRAMAMDPSRNRRATLAYVTVATGRDYRDVAPTRGTYRGEYAGTLTATKRAHLVAVERVAMPEEDRKGLADARGSLAGEEARA